MTYEIILVTELDGAGLRRRWSEIVETSPFAFDAPLPAGPGRWTLHLAPRRPDVRPNFAKVAELLVLLARVGTVESLARTDLVSDRERYAAAS